MFGNNLGEEYGKTSGYFSELHGDQGRSNLPDLSDEIIIDELNDAIKYLSENSAEAEGIETSDGITCLASLKS